MPLNEVIDQNMWNCPLADLEPIVLEIEVHESHADVLGGLEVVVRLFVIVRVPIVFQLNLSFVWGSICFHLL